MQIAFIRQTEEVLNQLERLHERAVEEESEFRFRIASAKDFIEGVVNTYHEVLNRDATEDEAYIPPLKEIK